MSKNLIKKLLLLVGLITIFMSIGGVFATQPYGAQLFPIKNVTAAYDNASSVQAWAGNITEMNVYGYTTTKGWQGYFGNITGTIQLADENDYVMYNWSNINPRGQIYASRNYSIPWDNIMCFNYTANGTYDDDLAQQGNTSLYGMNQTQLNLEYGFLNQTLEDVDSPANTFKESVTHDLFYVGKWDFQSNECPTALMYDNTQSSVYPHFQEMLMYEPTGASVVFTALINQNYPQGFDLAYHNFEMMVLENGHGNDVTTTTYYFYIELM